jgi:hypothetical protein
MWSADEITGDNDAIRFVLLQILQHGFQRWQIAVNIGHDG